MFKIGDVVIIKEAKYPKNIYIGEVGVIIEDSGVYHPYSLKMKNEKCNTYKDEEYGMINNYYWDEDELEFYNKNKRV